MSLQRWGSRHPILLGFAWLFGSAVLFLIFAKMEGLPIDLLLANTSLSGTSTVWLVVILVAMALCFGFGMKLFIDYVQPKLPRGRVANIVGYVAALGFILFLWLR